MLQRAGGRVRQGPLLTACPAMCSALPRQREGMETKTGSTGAPLELMLAFCTEVPRSVEEAGLAAAAGVAAIAIRTGQCLPSSAASDEFVCAGRLLIKCCISCRALCRQMLSQPGTVRGRNNPWEYQYSGFQNQGLQVQGSTGSKGGSKGGKPQQMDWSAWQPPTSAEPQAATETGTRGDDGGWGAPASQPPGV